jgi:hypothetical protein
VNPDFTVFLVSPTDSTRLIDEIAVDLQEPARLDLRRRLQDEGNLRNICPRLIEVSVK